MVKKSIIEARDFVPEYFGNNREFQVFLRLINIALSVIKSNSDEFISNLLNPLLCKSRLLPLLSNYVGYDYDPTERVVTNRWIIKLYPLLVRNRGNEIGLTLAIALSISLLGDPDEISLNLEDSFSIEMDKTHDKYGRELDVIRVYMHFPSYISILKKLIEVVRPAGVKVEFIPSQSISSSETIVLTDEFMFTKYDYITGKLLSINDIDIYVQNSWQLMIDEHHIKNKRWKDLEPYIWDEVKQFTWGDLQDSGKERYGSIPGLAPYEIPNKVDTPATYWNRNSVWLTDGRFYDTYGNDLGRYIDNETGRILLDDGSWNNEIIKETRVYVIDNNGNEIYTGMFFDVSNPAKVLETYYQLLDDGSSNGYYLSNDNLIIYDNKGESTTYRLKEELMLIDGMNKPVWKLYDSTYTIKYNWHVDLQTRRFIRDSDGHDLTEIGNKMPFSNTTYLDKKAYIMKRVETSDSVSFTKTQYFVNRYGDISDNAGNIILAKKDRYKISDSNMIGFSEVHNSAKQLNTYDGTNILAREWSFMRDDHIADIWGRAKTTDFSEYEVNKDPRYKFDHETFIIGNPVREYNGTDQIRFLKTEDLEKISCENSQFKIPLFVENIDAENSEGMLIIDQYVPPQYTLADIFSNMNIRFEQKIPNNELNPYWDIYIDWTANNKNKSYFNLSDLENPIHFIKKGKIEKRTLHWTNAVTHGIISPKIYDGTTRVYTSYHKNPDTGDYQEILHYNYKGGEQ